MDNKNTIQKAIDYLGIYATKSEKFADFKFIGKSIDNPLQVSYISQKKIDSLLEYTETKILGTKEQRQKHFTSTTIFKLLQNMFINEADRTTTIASDIDKQLRKDFCKDAGCSRFPLAFWLLGCCSAVLHRVWDILPRASLSLGFPACARPTLSLVWVVRFRLIRPS